MYKLKLTTLLVPVIAFIVVYPAHAKKSGLKTEKQKLSYTMGYQVGMSFKRNGIDIDTDAAAMAIRDAMKGKPPRLTREQMQQSRTKFQQKLMTKRKALGEKNLKLSQVFMKKNKKKKGVKARPSGLQYEILKKGKGAKPSAADKVEVHYHGTLIDGSVFDSSVKRGQTITFPVNGVIKGWQEVLPLMKKGAKWRVAIPPDLAYGPMGSPPKIGPNMALVFDIELVDIK